MHIQTLLNEEFAPAAPAVSVRYDDLSTQQVRTLQRIADGVIDVDSADEKEYDIIADLHELGLLDDEYALTKRGLAAVQIAKKLGGSAEVLQAQRRQAKLDNGPAANDDIELDVDAGVVDGDELPPVEDEDEYEFDVNAGRPQTRFAM